MDLLWQDIPPNLKDLEADGSCQVRPLRWQAWFFVLADRVRRMHSLEEHRPMEGDCLSSQAKWVWLNITPPENRRKKRKNICQKEHTVLHMVKAHG